MRLVLPNQWTGHHAWWTLFFLRVSIHGTPTQFPTIVLMAKAREFNMFQYIGFLWITIVWHFMYISPLHCVHHAPRRIFVIWVILYILCATKYIKCILSYHTLHYPTYHILSILYYPMQYATHHSILSLRYRLGGQHPDSKVQGANMGPIWGQ